MNLYAVVYVRSSMQANVKNALFDVPQVHQRAERRRCLFLVVDEGELHSNMGRRFRERFAAGIKGAAGMHTFDETASIMERRTVSKGAPSPSWLQQDTVKPFSRLIRKTSMAVHSPKRAAAAAHRPL